MPFSTLNIHAGFTQIPGFFKPTLYFIILTISILSTNNVFAQFTYKLDKTTRFERMGAEEGLSSGLAYSIHQDKYGFIWIGTQFGLNMYNGYELKVFYADPKNPQAIFNDWTLSISEEEDGTLWFGTSKGLSRYNRANQTFSNFLTDTIDLNNRKNWVSRLAQDSKYIWVNAITDIFRFNKITGQFRSFQKDTTNPEKGLHGKFIEHMYMGRSGVLWVGTADKRDGYALNKFNKETETFTHFEPEPFNPRSFVNYPVESIVEDKGGTIWVATRGGGLLELVDKENGEFKRYTHDENDTNSLIHNNLRKVFEDSKGNIWIGGFTGFALLNTETGHFTNYHVAIRTVNPIRHGAIYDIGEDNNGDLYLNSHDGFFKFNQSTKVLLHYLYDPGNSNSISHNWIHRTIYDSTGQAWMVLPHSSVNKINPFSNAFRQIQKKTHLNNSLSGSSVGRFFTDSKNNFWVGGGYSAGGLSRTKTIKQKVYDNFEHFVFDAEDPNSISGDIIHDICEDRDQIMWFATWDGLNRYDYKTNSFTNFQHNPLDSTSISWYVVESVYEDSYGTLWVGTRQGLNIFDRASGKFIRFLPDEKDSGSISSHDIRVIFEDAFGDLWFGGNYLEKLNRSDSSFIHYMPDPNKKSDIYRSVIWGIKEDDSTNLWFASQYGGLFKLNRRSMTFTTLTKNNGLPSNTVNAIEIDNRGFIWASTNQGLSRVDPHDYSIRNFDMADGLVSLEFINRSSYKDAEGWLYFGSRDGFNVFHPDSIKENKFIPPVYITSLRVAGEPKYFDEPLYELEEIELQYDENDFSFEFVALNYINSQKNQYAYILKGYDNEWNYVGNRRTAFYTNISPGKYTFWVKGSNNDGYWNEEGATLAVIIYPPFWKTWWAYGLYGLIILFVLYVIFRFYLRRQRLLHNLEMEQLNAKKLAELDLEKNKFFANISHEFRTPLTLILGPLDRFMSGLKNEAQKQELNLVWRNARRLQSLINQLLSLSKIESGKMKLKARPENIVRLMSLLLQSFHSMAEDRDIKMEFESDAEECIAYVDTIKFEKIINNLLSNALKFTKRGGKIRVILQSAVGSPRKNSNTVQTSDLRLPTSNYLQIKFSDTGIGIKKEELPHVFDRFYQVDEKQMKTSIGTGIGLALTKELVELHHGSITADSKPGLGTTFIVALPMGKDHLSEDETYEPSKNGSETDDDLLNDDYLFVQDVVSRPKLQKDLADKSNLPLLLIVEDNDDMRAYIISYLIESYNIIEAVNGKEGTEKAIEQIPDLIVSDLMMPFVDGNEMTTLLKTDERTSHIPIILLTAKASKESRLEGLETGADDFLTKPFDADELIIRIKNLIGQRRKLSLLLSQHLGDTNQTHLIQQSSGRVISILDELFIKKVTAFVQEQMTNPELNVEMFASKMAMSRMQLHRKLKSLMDTTASELIRNIRLMKAAELLKEGRLNVTQVSYEIGILSLSNFAKTFKEKYGVNPSEYIR